MSTKVSKSTKSVTAAVKAKETKAAAKTKAAPRMTEDDKKADTENYILNTGTGKYVKRDSPMGKKLVKAEETGEEVAKTMTETARLILFIQTLADQLGLEDSAIKAALVTDESVKSEMPRGFPNSWGGKQKTARSPDHPKQPSNPYIFFTKAVRAATVLANPDAKNTEIVSIMAKQWKETAEEDRTEYNESAAADKIRYEEAMKIFEAEHPDQARAKSSPGSGKPTKETAYHLFSEEHRKSVETENPDLDGKQITKKLAEMWDLLKKEDKEKVAEYQAAADKANEDFEDRVAEYNNSPGASPKLSKAEQAKADDPEHYDLNTKTNRYVLKEGWKRNPDGSFVKVVKKDAASPKTPKGKPVAKPVAKKAATVTKPAAKPVAKPAAKPAAKPIPKKAEVEEEEIETQDIEDETVVAKVESNDDDLLIE